jgi:hypothetical protein
MIASSLRKDAYGGAGNRAKPTGIAWLFVESTPIWRRIMPTKKDPERRITNVRCFTLADSSGIGFLSKASPDRGVILEVLCRDSDVRLQVLTVLRSDKGKREMRSLVYELLREGKSDPKRDWLMQPQIPVAVSETFNEIKARIGPRSGNALIKKYLSEVFNLERGTRKMRKNQLGKRVMCKFKNNIQFVDRGRALVKGVKLRKFTFNPRTHRAKQVLLDYMSSYGLTQTEFFSALVERICENESNGRNA